MVESISLAFILIIFLFIGLTFGFNRAIAAIPFLFIVFLLIYFAGWLLLAFWPIILIVVLINYIRNKNEPKTTKRRYYFFIF